MAEDPWTVLGLDHSATVDEARASYRELLALYHPDRHQGAAPNVMARADEKTRAINEAWQAIRDGGAIPPPDQPTPSDPETERSMRDHVESSARVARDRDVSIDRPIHRRGEWKPAILIASGVFAALILVVAAVIAATREPDREYESVVGQLSFLVHCQQSTSLGTEGCSCAMEVIENELDYDEFRALDDVPLAQYPSDVREKVDEECA